MHGLQEEFPIPEEDSYIDDVHMWLERNDDEVCLTWCGPFSVKHCLCCGCRMRCSLFVSCPASRSACI
jgi:hypothetical protein